MVCTNVWDLRKYLKKIEYDLTVCKVHDISDIDLTTEFYFIGKTDEELSLVCKTEDTPAETIDGYKGKFFTEKHYGGSVRGVLRKGDGEKQNHYHSYPGYAGG